MPIRTQGRVRDFTFGLGSLESVTLRTWRTQKFGDENIQVHGRLTGTWTVYCGMGNDHTVEIDERVDGWLSERTRDSDVRHLVAAHVDSDEDAAETLAHQLIEYGLEDWFDPCDNGDGE
jgi:hypothetical protein